MTIVCSIDDFEYVYLRRSLAASKGNLAAWRALEANSVLDLSMEEAQELTRAFKQEEAKERRRCRSLFKRLQQKAEPVGLTAWGVLQSKELSPQGFAQFERVAMATPWFVGVDHLMLFGEDEAGWRMRDNASGTFLVTAADAHLLVHAAGDKAGKLELLLELLCERGWSLREVAQLTGASCVSIKQLLVGQEWVATHAKGLMRCLGRQAYRAIGRTKEPLRWALVRDVGNRATQARELRGLNWALVKQASKSPALRFALLPPSHQWTKLFGFAPPSLLSVPSMVGFKVGTWRKLCPMMGLRQTRDGLREIGNVQPLFNLVRLFGDLESIRRFVAASGKPWTKKGLHDAGQFSLPPAKDSWTPERWAPLCLRYPQLVTQAGDFSKLERRGIFPKSPNEFRREKVRLTYPTVPAGFEQLAELCISANLTGRDFETNLKFWQTVKQKTAEFMPHVEVQGEEVGLDAGWKFSRLASSDYRGPLLGQLSGCCQHLNGAGRESAVHGVTSPYSGFYVVTHNDKVVAQSWAWRNKAGDVVFDSVESIVREAKELKPVFALYKEAVARMVKTSLGVSAVYIGATHSGITNLVAKAIVGGKCGPFVSTEPFDSGGYFDGLTHTRVAGKALKRTKALPKVEDYKVTRHDPLQHDFELFETNAVMDLRRELYAQFGDELSDKVHEQLERMMLEQGF